MATQVRDSAARKPAKPGSPAAPARTGPREFVREVVYELRKVIWPTRKELITYTTVALVFVVIMSAIVTGLDTGFTRLIFAIFS